MQKHGIYFANNSFYQLMRDLGGEWADQKERPFICLSIPNEPPDLFWAIPLGSVNHRNKQALSRIDQYLNYESSDIRSCFYHLGKTDVKSIFFISDAFPITPTYVKKEYLNRYTHHPHIIKNHTLLSDLERKLRRILYWENKHPNYFRQHISSLKNYLLNELKENNV